MKDRDNENFNVDGTTRDYYGSNRTDDVKRIIESTITKIKKTKDVSHKSEKVKFGFKAEKPPVIDPAQIRARQREDALRELNIAVRQVYFSEGSLPYYAEKLHNIATVVLPGLTDMNEIRLNVYNSCLDNMLWIIQKMEKKIASLGMEEPLPEFESKELLILARDIAQKIKGGNFDSDEWNEEEYKAAINALEKEINGMMSRPEENF